LQFTYVKKLIKVLNRNAIYAKYLSKYSKYCDLCKRIDQSNQSTALYAIIDQRNAICAKMIGFRENNNPQKNIQLTTLLIANGPLDLPRWAFDPGKASVPGILATDGSEGRKGHEGCRRNVHPEFFCAEEIV
jgi:hypothetical protein